MTEIHSTSNESTFEDNKKLNQKVKYPEYSLVIYNDREDLQEILREKEDKKLFFFLNNIRIDLLNGKFEEAQILNIITIIEDILPRFSNIILMNLMKEVRLIAQKEIIKIQNMLY